MIESKFRETCPINCVLPEPIIRGMKMSAGVFLAVGVGLFVAFMVYLASRDGSSEPTSDKAEPEAKPLSNGAQSLFGGWKIADYIAPVDMRTRVVDGKEYPETALMRFGEHAKQLYMNQVSVPSVELGRLGVDAIVHVFPTFVVYHSAPKDIQHSSFIIFSPPTNEPEKAIIETGKVSSLLKSDPRNFMEEFSNLLDPSSLNDFVEKKYGKASDPDEVSDKDMDDIFHGMMERSSKWESKGGEIAEDCLNNGLLKGEIVRLSEITNAIRQHYSYNANVVEHGFLTKMKSYVDQGSVININAEGGDMVFVHKNHAEEILGRS